MGRKREEWGRHRGEGGQTEAGEGVVLAAFLLADSPGSVCSSEIHACYLSKHQPMVFSALADALLNNLFQDFSRN